jgi:hypothetical protein
MSFTLDEAQLGQLLAELSGLHGAVDELVDVVGTDPSTDDPDRTGCRGTGLRRRLAELERKIGDSPDPATCKEGSGLLKAIYEHMAAATGRGRRMVGASAIGGAAAVGLIELGVELLKFVNG